jgi:PKD repeat protein
LVFLALFCASTGCDAETTDSLSTDLFADPELCGVPCEVVIDSGIGATSTPLTFTWDVGSGPMPGEERLFHTFENVGTYEVSLTVSNGAKSTTDAVTVRAEPQPKSSTSVDEAGGEVSQGSGAVSVPAGIAPDTFTLALTELPSMQAGAERAFGTERFTVLGSAYDAVMPLKAGAPIDMAVTDPEAIGKDPSDFAWLIRTVSVPEPPSSETSPLHSGAPLADYMLVPVTEVDTDGTVHGEIYGNTRFQLVRLVAPLDVEFAAPAQLALKAVPTPFVITVFNDAPTGIDKDAFTSAVFTGVTQSHDVLVSQRGFVGPKGTITVVVGKLKDPSSRGHVSIFDHQTIHLNHSLESTDEVKKTVAHEFFHLIQNLNSNTVSKGLNHKRDAWFKEGTASWAMDEVFDSIRDTYYATTWKRFEVPLLQMATSADSDVAYQTVAFWKWAEANNATIIRRIIEDRFLQSHTSVVGLSHVIENLANVDYLSSLTALWATADFLEYAYDARYLKDFDTQEDREGELWWEDTANPEARPFLGPPKVVYEQDKKVVSKGAGDSETNPVRLAIELKRHLTADVQLVENVDLVGTLHVRFPVLQAPLDARVIVLDRTTNDLEDSYTVRDLSIEHVDVQTSFDPDEKAVIFVADPSWSYAADATPITAKVQVWVDDPCGALPSNVIDVTPSDDLYVALTTAPEGSVVRLAPGTYTPPIQQWPTPEYGPFGANVLVQNLTLAGSAEGETRIVMTGDPYAGLGLKTYGNATLRDLTIDARDSEPAIDCLDAKHVKLCNVTLQASSTTDYGILWGPWNGGVTSLLLQNSALVHPNREHAGTGVSLQACYETPANVSVEIRNTQASGWGEGVSFFSGEGYCGSISVTSDCSGFSNNGYNVVEWQCAEAMCEANEQCP